MRLALRAMRCDVVFKTVLVVWIFASTAVGRCFTALVRDPTDSQLFAYIGLEWTHKRLPYLEIWENKPPGIFAIDAAAFYFWPKSFNALAIIEALFILGTVATIFLILWCNFEVPLRFALVAATAASIGVNLQAYNELGNLTEIYLIWPAALSIFFFTKPYSRAPVENLVLAGLFSGIAALLKPVGFAPLFGEWAAIVWFVISRRMFAGRGVLSCMTLFSGAVLAWIPAIIYFALHGAAREMLNASLLFNIHYGLASQQHGTSELLIIASKLQPISTVVVCAVLGFAVLVSFSLKKNLPVASRPALSSWPVVLFWVLFDLAGAVAGGRNYSHYFLPVVASLSVAAGLGFWIWFEHLPRLNVVAALVLCPLLLSQATDWLWLRNILVRQDAKPLQRLSDKLKLVAEHLNAERRPDDTLFIWNYLPQVYFDTGMVCPSRFVASDYIWDFPRARSTIGSEILSALERRPPTFVLDATPDPERAIKVPLYARFHQLLVARYELEFTIPNPNSAAGVGDLNVFKLRDSLR